ncbi:hypothetical protein GJ496_010893 [Pomphorhynchus laevis]|nr:hypothetical protein GJ496_010893 [Pomphorhynchus laevis]
MDCASVNRSGNFGSDKSKPSPVDSMPEADNEGPGAQKHAVATKRAVPIRSALKKKKPSKSPSKAKSASKTKAKAAQSRVKARKSKSPMKVKSKGKAKVGKGTSKSGVKKVRGAPKKVNTSKALKHPKSNARALKKSVSPRRKVAAK